MNLSQTSLAPAELGGSLCKTAVSVFLLALTLGLNVPLNRFRMRHARKVGL